MKEEQRILIKESDAIISRWSTYTRDELVAELDRSIEKLPEDQRDSVYFEIDIETFPYDSGEYPKLFMIWQRPETDKEMADRLKKATMYQKTQKERELAEFKRLQKIYGEKK